MADEIMNNERTATEAEEALENNVNDEDAEWDAISWKETADDLVGDAVEEPAPEAGEAEGEVKEGTSEPEDVEAEDTDQYLELKHFDEIKKVSKEEAKTLAQKGLDYDRLRSERDEMKSDYKKLKEYESFLNDLKGNFASIDDLMLDTRARMMADKDGVEYEKAVERIKSENAKKEEPKANDSIDKFVSKYPDVKAEDIPEEVWSEVRKTGDLVGAYSNYENKKMSSEISELKKQIEILKQNERNSMRSAGSSTSSGKTNAKTTIQKLWDEYD